MLLVILNVDYGKWNESEARVVTLMPFNVNMSAR